jgi:uncharacterized damage-inducible protein DinB
MDMLAHIRLMANYNRWMNGKCLDAAAKLPHDAVTADRGAYFQSILGTLNHLCVVDIVWLRRFAKHSAAYSSLDGLRDFPEITSLRQTIAEALPPLRIRRGELDAIVVAWTEAIEAQDLDHSLEFETMGRQPSRKNFGALVLNLFNHQTHHRGQLTTLLTQAGVDVGVTDLYALIPDEGSA